MARHCGVSDPHTWRSDIQDACWSWSSKTAFSSCLRLLLFALPYDVFFNVPFFSPTSTSVFDIVTKKINKLTTVLQFEHKNRYWWAQQITNIHFIRHCFCALNQQQTTAIVHKLHFFHVLFFFFPEKYRTPKSDSAKALFYKPPPFMFWDDGFHGFSHHFKDFQIKEFQTLHHSTKIPS